MKYREEESGIGILIFIWIMVVMGCLLKIKDSDGLISVYILMGFGGIMTLIYIPVFLRTLKFRKECKKIVENGLKVQGRIVDYSIEIHNHEPRHRYRVIVTYLDPYTNIEKKYINSGIIF